LAEKLAIQGGSPFRSSPWPGHYMDLDENEIFEVMGVLKSKRLAQLTAWRSGKSKVQEFQHELARYFGVKYAIATSAGTAAIHSILHSLKIGCGDEVIVTPIAFIGSQGPVLMQNAIPIFADVDEKTLCMSPEEAEIRITERTRAILPVHLYGHPFEVDELMEVAEKHGIPLVEDASHVHGAEYKGKKCGSFGLASAFSLWELKVIGVGNGGFLLTNDEDVARGVYEAINHCRKVVDLEKWVTTEDYCGIGYNYRMTELQAAIGLCQIRKLDHIVETRTRNAEYLTGHLGQIEGIEPMYVAPYVKPSYYTYHMEIDEKLFGITASRFAEALRFEGIPGRTGVEGPVYLTRLFRERVGYGRNWHCPFDCPRLEKPVEYREGLCPVAERKKDSWIFLPVYPGLKKEDLDDIIGGVEKVADGLRAR